MASFFEDLWTSVFTPGPTPTLLIATNASFAALQLLLLALLVATHSIHFVILSVLTAGLWWAINWFAAEITAAQAKEEEAKRIREAKKGRDKEKGTAEDDDGGMDSGDDTEVDAEVERREQEQKIKIRPNKPASRSTPKMETQSTVFVQKPATGGDGDAEAKAGAPPLQSSAGPAGSTTRGTTTSLAPLVDDAVKKRRNLNESTGELSTDSEWEKLSQDSGER